MEKTEFNSWKYYTYIERGKVKYTIEPFPKKDAPVMLSKYYSITDNSINAIKNLQFYISQPEDFNDIFDSHHSLIDFQNITFTTALNFLNKGKFNTDISKMWKEDKIELIKFIQHMFYSILLSRIGILCFTTNKYDELMWGYYNNHEGFLIEFDYSKFGKNYNGPFPINYVQNLSSFDINYLGGNLAFLIQTTIKKLMWQHEDEYRFLVEPQGNDFEVQGLFSNKDTDLPFDKRLVNYPKEAIKQIILGFRFLKNEELTIINDNTYEIRFLNTFILKKELFEIIAERNIMCKSIIQNSTNYILEDEPWIITNLGDSRFEVKR